MLPTMDEVLTALIIKDVSLSAANTQTVCSQCKRPGYPAEWCYELYPELRDHM